LELVGASTPAGITSAMRRRRRHGRASRDGTPARSDTSIGVATSLGQHGEADAVVSAGNTGATMAAALLVLAEFAASIAPRFAACCRRRKENGLPPRRRRDDGRRREQHPSIRAMASRFMEKVHGVDRPSVGLINVGEEPEKADACSSRRNALLEGAEDSTSTGTLRGAT